VAANQDVDDPLTEIGLCEGRPEHSAQKIPVGLLLVKASTFNRQPMP